MPRRSTSCVKDAEDFVVVAWAKDLFDAYRFGNPAVSGRLDASRRAPACKKFVRRLSSQLRV
jgi:hypothetical protein